MASPKAQRQLFDVLTRHFDDSTVFTMQQLLDETGWEEVTLNTYKSKMLGSLFEPTTNGQFRVTETFRRYRTWDSFRRLVSQKKSTMLSKYNEERHGNPVVFEFFLPLAHELLLRDALDSLFFRERVIARLKALPIAEMRGKWNTEDDDANYIEAVASLIGSKFAGYSIGQVAGRYRAGPFSTKVAAQALEANGGKYLIDETTAVVRFICPLDVPEANEISQIAAIRYLFDKIFVQTVLEVVDKEAEVWVLESGAESNLHIWKRVDA